MAYVVLSLAALLLVLLAVMVATSRRHRRLIPRLPAHPHRFPQRAELLKLEQSGRFRGVNIEAHCHAASHLAGREFAFDAVPGLPVSGCDAAVCACAYVGLPERRHGLDRRSGRDRRLAFRGESIERRSDRPRRKDDFVPWGVHGRL